MRTVIVILCLTLTQTCVVDEDGDGYDASEDCNDGNAYAYPGAAEFCNGYDEDCDGVADNDCCGAYDCGCTRLCTDGEACGGACIYPPEVCHVGGGTACYQEGA